MLHANYFLWCKSRSTAAPAGSYLCASTFDHLMRLPEQLPHNTSNSPFGLRLKSGAEWLRRYPWTAPELFQKSSIGCENVSMRRFCLRFCLTRFPYSTAGGVSRLLQPCIIFNIRLLMYVAFTDRCTLLIVVSWRIVFCQCHWRDGIQIK